MAGRRRRDGRARASRCTRSRATSRCRKSRRPRAARLKILIATTGETYPVGTVLGRDRRMRVRRERPRHNFADDLPPWPAVDFAAFGEVEVKPLPRMRKIAAGFLARNWAMIPHVTHHDDADVTALEALRKELNGRSAGEAHAAAVPGEGRSDRARRVSRSSMHRSTPASGNVVLQEVLPHRHRRRHAERAAGAASSAIATSAACARSPTTSRRCRRRRERRGCRSRDMSGGCFTITSLGGVGGTYFTPIINAPEVAILGVCRARWAPQRGAGERRSTGD